MPSDRRHHDATRPPRRPRHELRVEQRGPVLWLTINREERRNAMSHGVLAGMAQAITAAQADRARARHRDHRRGRQGLLRRRRPAVGQGLHHRLFASRIGHLAQLLRAAKASHVPLVARVNGACMAGGMGLLAMCDLAVAARHAVFGLPEVKVGVFPAQVLSVLQHLIPRRQLAEMCLTGEPITSAQALEYGLVNYVDDDVDARLQWLLDRLLDKSPAAIRRGLYTMKKIEIDGVRGERCASPKARSRCSR